MTTRITRATPDQAQALTHIAFAAKRHWGYPEHWIQLWAPLLTITPEFISQGETYIAWDDEQPVGVCALSQAAQNTCMEHLWVLPEFMGRGIGAALFQYVLARCKELGVRVLEIESDPNAQGFYEHMGAKKIGEVARGVDGQPRVLPLLRIEIQ